MNKKEQNKYIKSLELEITMLKNTIDAMYTGQLAVDRLNGEWLLKARKLIHKLPDNKHKGFIHE